MKNAVVGAQLYSARDYCKDIKGVRETFRRVKEIGYQAVQVSGFGPVDPAEVADAAKEHGLTVGATHLGWQQFKDDLDSVIALHKQWNCIHTAIGGLPTEYFCREGVERFIEEATPIAKLLAAVVMDFSYHNHHHELVRYGDQTWLGALYQLAPASVIKAEIDTHWIQAGGADPAAWIQMCAGRAPVIHLKDMIITEARQLHFAPVGSGNLNWQAILAAMDAAGTEFAFVEQDDCYGEDVFTCLESSYRFLSDKGYR